MEKKKWSKGQKITVGILFGLIVIIIAIVSVIPKDKVKTNVIEVTKYNWDTLSIDKKEAWIKAALVNRVPDDFYTVIMESIRNQFKFPDEVSFIDVPIASHADITLADSGLVFFHGIVTAKNAFGVKGRYAYQIRTFIRPDTVYIDRVSVSER